MKERGLGSWDNKRGGGLVAGDLEGKMSQCPAISGQSGGRFQFMITAFD